MPLLPASFRLLIHPSPDRELADRFREELTTVSEWLTLITSLHQNGLLPLFRSALLDTGQYSLVPAGSQAVIDETTKRQAMRNLLLSATLKKIHTLFSEHSIPFALIKGYALATTCYKSPALRPMIDIDILVNPEDVLKIRELCAQYGGKEFSVPQTQFFASLTSHEPAILLDSVLIEPHTSLMKGKKTLGLHECQCISLAIEGRLYQVPVPEIHLLFLMNHVHRHLSRERCKLLWLRDVACLMQKIFCQEDTGKEFFRLAESHGCHTQVKEIAGLMLELLPGLVPENTGIRPHISERMARSLKEVSLHGMKGSNRPEPRLRYFSEMLDQKGKIYFLAGLLFPRPAYLKNRYRNLRVRTPFLIYPFHFFRVLGKGIFLLFRSFYHRVGFHIIAISLFVAGKLFVGN